MRHLVPCHYFDYYNTQPYTFVYENRTLILVRNIVHGFVQYLFLLQEPHKHIIQPMPAIEHRSGSYPLTQIPACSYTLPEWQDVQSVADPRSLVSTLHFGVLSGLELHKNIKKFQPMPAIEHRSGPYPLTQIPACSYTLPKWQDVQSVADPRSLASTLHFGVLSGLDYLWVTRVESDENTNGVIYLEKKSLPNTQLLNHLCLRLGRKSTLIKVMCKKICLELKKRSNTIVDVWAAYVPDKENEIRFMVITEKNCKRPKILDRQVDYRCIDEYSTEAAYVIENENPLNNGLRKDLRSVVNRYTGALLLQHKNITTISISSVKSRNFNTGKELSPGPCIVIYVHVKGMIPIDEEPLPTSLEGFDVDVREGAFSPFLHQPDQVPDSISIGCQIQGPGENVDEHGHVLGGTLGGFIDHPNFGLCCITSAHVILSNQTMHSVKSFGWQPPHSNSSICYQPCPPDKFGRVVAAVCKEGDDNSSGVEIVMIKVEGRTPTDISAEILLYKSGDILELPKLLQQIDNNNMEVIKYGAETGVTKGKIQFEQSTIKFTNAEVSHRGFNFTLRNQIEIIGEGIFAKPGDSGAIVFHFVQNEPLKAIGLLEGGTSYNTFIVTPMCEILKSLGLTPPLRMKICDHVPMATNHDVLEQRVENLEQATENIKADVAAIKTELEQQRQTMDQHGQTLDQHGQKLDQIIALLTARA